ncbi:ABC-type transport system periplasmic binding protein [Nitrospira sp. KM1]|uniref:cobalamin-binding protein n=1 Tax=Nitrospira sp. KM1 TaxID=1936990 RepID=UPI0013A7B312|nr:cobalamin-binding protein [Nitrospira sp. KM1]BCA57006.1 ABC-type transport system periplasmic binding protein [Nitrospira sp. KM1]
MRICSFVPGATEVVAALGLADDLVGISHECDYPTDVRHARILVESLVDSRHSSSARIDQEVKHLAASSGHLYRLDERAFIEANPDTLLIQDLCHVCAVTPDQIGRAVKCLSVPPRIVKLNPTTLDAVLHDIARIGKAVEQCDRACRLTTSLRDRLEQARAHTSSSIKPRVLCLEWLAPLYAGGHWIPEMVDMAGGIDVVGQAGQPSREISWQEAFAAAPDIVILMPCGFGVSRTCAEVHTLLEHSTDWSRAALEWPNVFVVDATSYFSRPGPRLVDGVELLASVFSGHIDAETRSPSVRRVSWPMNSTRF